MIPASPAQPMTAEEFAEHVEHENFYGAGRTSMALQIEARDALLLAAARQSWEVERAALLEKLRNAESEIEYLSGRSET